MATFFDALNKMKWSRNIREMSFGQKKKIIISVPAFALLRLISGLFFGHSLRFFRVTAYKRANKKVWDFYYHFEKKRITKFIVIFTLGTDPKCHLYIYYSAQHL